LAIACDEREDDCVRLLNERCNSITVEKIRLPATFRAFALVSSDPRKRRRKIRAPGVKKS
jgi:hypothetical protein